MKVYVVTKGERGEGGSIEGVFKTLSLAKECALNIKPCFGSWNKSNDPDEPYTWWNGCDFIEIEEHKVLGR